MLSVVLFIVGGSQTIIHTILYIVGYFCEVGNLFARQATTCEN